MKRFSFFSTLRGRVILLILVTILPAVGLLIYYGLEGRANATVEASDETLQLARQKSDLYEDTIRNVRQTLFTLSQIPQVRQHEPESCSAIFANLLRQTEAYTGLAAVKPDGEVFASAPPITRPTSFADRPWFQRVMETRDFVMGEYGLGRITGKPLIVLAYPVLDPKGEIMTVLCVGLDLAWVSKTLRKSELPKGMTLTLIDSNGTILLHFPNHEELVGKEMHEEFLIRTMLTRGEGTDEGIGLDGRACLFGFTSMGKGTEAIYIGVSIPKALAFAHVRRSTVQSLILLLLMAATGLVGGWFIAGLFVLSPVKRLLQMTKQLATGDLSIRSGSPYVTGEIGQLTHHFDIMADSLKRREGERDRAEEALRESEERLRMRNRIARVFLTFPDKEMYGEVLGVILKAMKSEYGVFGYIDEDGAWVCPSMTRDIWDKCRISDKDIVFPRDTWGGIWGKALIEKKTLCSNGPFKVPEGHLPIFRALDVPIVHQGEVIGNVVVGNKETDYDGKDKELLEEIADYIAPVLHARLQRDREEKAGERLSFQLRRTQKMEAISTLAGGIAHDFNNILSAIMGYGQLAQTRLDPESEPYADLEEVLISANRAKSLIRQILAVGRSQEQERRPMQFRHIVKEALKFLRSTLPSTIEIQEKIDKDVGVIDADPTQMHQVLMNLCTNAGHAMDISGGILTVRLRNVDFGLRNGDLKLEESRLKIPPLKTGSSTSHEAVPSV